MQLLITAYDRTNTTQVAGVWSVDSADVRAAAAQPGASASVQAVWWCLYTAAPGTAWHRLVTSQPPAAGGKSRVLKCAHFIKPGPGGGFIRGCLLVPVCMAAARFVKFCQFYNL